MAWRGSCLSWQPSHRPAWVRKYGWLVKATEIRIGFHAQEKSDSQQMPNCQHKPSFWLLKYVRFFFFFWGGFGQGIVLFKCCITGLVVDIDVRGILKAREAGWMWLPWKIVSFLRAVHGLEGVACWCTGKRLLKLVDLLRNSNNFCF